jgi:hypothetical protein
MKADSSITSKDNLGRQTVISSIVVGVMMMVVYQDPHMFFKLIAMITIFFTGASWGHVMAEHTMKSKKKKGTGTGCL